MASLDEILGVSQEEFNDLYDRTNGFNPSYPKEESNLEEGETFDEFLKKGAEALMSDPDTVKAFQDVFNPQSEVQG